MIPTIDQYQQYKKIIVDKESVLIELRKNRDDAFAGLQHLEDLVAMEELSLGALRASFDPLIAEYERVHG